MSGEDDLLERATRALKETPPPSDEELRIERAVLLRAHRAATQKASNKSRVLRWVLPLAAVLTAGSALAATTGQIERAVQVVSEWLGAAPTSEPQRAKRVRSREQVVRERRPQPVAEPSVAPTLPAPEPTPVVEPQPERQRAPAPEPRRSAKRPVPEPSGTVAVADDASTTTAAPEASAQAEPKVQEPLVAPNGDLLRYREAHSLHFRERDFWAALRAWESYLSTYPDGTFAIEARYNRAICLVRLGRKDEARRALAPFAKGEVGRGYRKAEASELLKALE